MRYLLKQDFLSWGKDFTIQDASGNDAFVVDGKAFRLGEQLSLRDIAGNERAFIKQRLLSLGPTYEIHTRGELRAVVNKKLFTFFRCSFTVDVPGPDDLEAEGDFLDHEYEFCRGSRQVATVSKRWFTWTDSYGVDVAAGEDDVLVLASAVVIDLACHSDKKD
jgi:uncharacterized protein YxjI